jgi:protocatechuate 3,4-dioxygenase beta subunit
MGTPRPTRRSILKAGLGVPASLALGRIAWAAPVALDPTPACGDHPTISSSAGPFFKPDSPARTSLREPEIPGTSIVLTGRVLSTDCRPIAGALLDFWHADSVGAYDTVGNRLRGHQRSDGRGGYTLETILPGGYGSRTRHFHVKVQAPGQPVLTTELYFPREPRNAHDSLFRRELLVSLADAADGKMAQFDFVLALA